MPETSHAPDLRRLDGVELRLRLTAVQAALAAEPDVVTGHDGEPSVGVAVLDLLDTEREIRAELRRRAAAPGRSFRPLAQA
jgi:hypothetical protein